jgi:hypothetical protein
LSKGPIGHIKEKTSSNHSRTYSKRLKTGTGKDFQDLHRLGCSGLL